MKPTLQSLHKHWEISGAAPADLRALLRVFKSLQAVDDSLAAAQKASARETQELYRALFSLTGTRACFRLRGQYLIPWQRGGRLGFQPARFDPRAKSTRAGDSVRVNRESFWRRLYVLD